MVNRACWARELAMSGDCVTTMPALLATTFRTSPNEALVRSAVTFWSSFPNMAQGFAMTDPNKLTLLTPGFDRKTGAYEEHGIPAPVVAQYLRENRIVAEKNDLNSLLFLLTPGVEASKAGTL